MNENAAQPLRGIQFGRIIGTVGIASAGVLMSSLVITATIPVANADETSLTTSQTVTVGGTTTSVNDSPVTSQPVTVAPIGTVTAAPTEPVTRDPTAPDKTAPTEPVLKDPTGPVKVAPTEPVTTSPTEPAKTAPTEPVTTAPTEPVTTSPTEPVTTSPTEVTTSPTEPTTPIRPVQVAPTEPRTPTVPVTEPASLTPPVSDDTGTAAVPLHPVIITPPANADINSVSLFPFFSGPGSSDDADPIGWYHLPGWGSTDGGTFTAYLFRTGTVADDTSGISSIWGTAKVDETSSPFSTNYAALTSGAVAVDPKTGDPLLVDPTGPNEPSNWVTAPSAKWDELNVHPLGLQLFQHDDLSWPAMVVGSSTGATTQGLSQTLDTYLFNPFGHVLFGVEYGDTADGHVLDVIGPGGTAIPIMGGDFIADAAGGVSGILDHLLDYL